MSGAHDDLADARRLDGQSLSDLWVFRAAARLGSLTAAAQRLGVSQGAVSQRVLRLEARLGTPLFSRQKGGIALTAEGHSVFEAMNEAALVLNDCLGRIDRLHRSALVVSCVPSLATEWLVPNLEDFYAQHPDVEIFVRAEMGPATPERLAAEGIDLVIDYAPSAPGDLHQLAELRELVFPVAAPGYADALEDTGETPVLLQDDLSGWSLPADYEWKGWREAANTSWPGRGARSRHFNLAHLAYHAAMRGQGVAMGRAVLVHRLLVKGELAPIGGFAPVTGSVYRLLANRPGNARSATRRFAEWCNEAMAQTQGQTLALIVDEAAAANGGISFADLSRIDPSALTASLKASAGRQTRRGRR